VQLLESAGGIQFGTARPSAALSYYLGKAFYSLEKRIIYYVYFDQFALFKLAFSSIKVVIEKHSDFAVLCKYTRLTEPLHNLMAFFNK